MAKAPRLSSLEFEAESLIAYRSKPLEAAFLARGIRVLIRLAEALQPMQLTEVLTEETAAATVLQAMQMPGALRILRAEVGPMVGARLRGLERRAALLSDEGGTVSTAEAGKLLGGMSIVGVHKRRSKGRLIAFEEGKRGYRFPVWQFAEGGTLPGLETVLEALAHHPALAQARFFLVPSARLADRRPLDVLREGHVSAVVEAAKAFGEQAAS